MVVPWSNWAADSIINEYGVPRERVQVIPTGLDTSYWQPGTAEREHERLRLLFVGGNFERKGGRLLLDVFRGLDLQARAELHIVTRDPVESAPGVVVHHNIDNNSLDLLRLYQASDVFVLPTMADCFSNASIEAMAVGLPVITTNMGGIPDIVEHGKTGLLVEPGDGQEHNDEAGKATDTSSATYWETQHYRSSFALLGKRGVGLVLDAGKSVTVHHVTVTTDTPGFTAGIEAGDTGSGPFQPVSDPQTVSGQATFDLRNAHARYYVVWITNLGPLASAHVNNVSAS